MFKVKYVPPHHLFIKVEPEKKEPKIKEVVASVKTKKESQLVKTKKMTKLKKWVPKIATPTKSVDPK
jgi:hypothetical protein